MTLTNGQGKKVKYLSVTAIECRVCAKDNMRVRDEVKQFSGDSITQHLECPNCGEGYPRVISIDRKTVLIDPFSDTRKLR